MKTMQRRITEEMQFSAHYSEHGCGTGTCLQQFRFHVDIENKIFDN